MHFIAILQMYPVRPPLDGAEVKEFKREQKCTGINNQHYTCIIVILNVVGEHNAHNCSC